MWTVRMQKAYAEETEPLHSQEEHGQMVRRHWPHEPGQDAIMRRR